jgi:hypothetical protein
MGVHEVRLEFGEGSAQGASRLAITPHAGPPAHSRNGGHLNSFGAQ